MSWRTQRADGGTIFPSGPGSREAANGGKVVPAVTLAVEHYNRMVRILDKGIPVKVELDIKTQFFDETEPNGFNVLADIPGADPGGEFVLLGAHLDSVGTGTGATDNAAGGARLRLPLVRRCGDSGLSVHAGSAGVQLAHAPFEHGRRRSDSARRPRAGGRDRGNLRVQHGDARREAAAQAAAGAAAGRAA